ncbi:TPA: DegT/DnrJ/EryC1/StrS family aminotransferase [Streptococcus suis]
MSIPLYKPYLPIKNCDFAEDSLACGWLGYGEKAQKLETLFAERYGGWALAVTSCTSSLYLAARCMKRNDNDEVIIPAITFVSTGMAFRAAGYSVVCADVDAQGLLSIDSVKSAITPNTRAIVAVHLYGQRVHLDELRRLCDGYDIYLVEDCAHRVAIDDESHPGDFCCFSFNTMKELPSGEGGLLLGKDLKFETMAREFANLGLTENTLQRTTYLKHNKYNFGLEHGLKFLQNDIIASLTLKLMDVLDSNRIKRKMIFEKYNTTLSKYKEFYTFNREDDDSCLMFVVRIAELYVDEFRDFLALKGIASSHHYPNLSEHPLFEKRVPCPIAEQYEKEIISLPCFVEMTEEQIDMISDAIEEFAIQKGLSPNSNRKSDEQ